MVFSKLYSYQSFWLYTIAIVEFLGQLMVFHSSWFQGLTISPLIPQEQFMKAMKLVGEEFTNRVHSYQDVWLPAREIVQRAIADRCQVMC